MASSTLDYCATIKVCVGCADRIVKETINAVTNLRIGRRSNDVLGCDAMNKNVHWLKEVLRID